VKWVCRASTSLHHLVLSQPASHSDAVWAWGLAWGKASIDGIKSYGSEKENVTVLRDRRRFRSFTRAAQLTLRNSNFLIQLTAKTTRILTKIQDASRMPKSLKKKNVKKKNPVAVAFGMLGASKGGIARAKKLSPERRSEIARKSAAARWSRPIE
jgi:ribosomal protein L25 (general stress protein Ctc)